VLHEIEFSLQEERKNISKKNKNLSKFILQIRYQHHKLKPKKKETKTYKISKFVEEKLALTLEVSKLGINIQKIEEKKH
jgi:hypothetical protein